MYIRSTPSNSRDEIEKELRETFEHLPIGISRVYSYEDMPELEDAPPILEERSSEGSICTYGDTDSRFYRSSSILGRKRTASEAGLGDRY